MIQRKCQHVSMLLKPAFLALFLVFSPKIATGAQDDGQGMDAMMIASMCLVSVLGPGVAAAVSQGTIACLQNSGLIYSDIEGILTFNDQQWSLADICSMGIYASSLAGQIVVGAMAIPVFNKRGIRDFSVPLMASSCVQGLGLLCYINQRKLSR